MDKFSRPYACLLTACVAATSLLSAQPALAAEKLTKAQLKQVDNTKFDGVTRLQAMQSAINCAQDKRTEKRCQALVNLYIKGIYMYIAPEGGEESTQGNRLMNLAAQCLSTIHPTVVTFVASEYTIQAINRKYLFSFDLLSNPKFEKIGSAISSAWTEALGEQNGRHFSRVLGAGRTFDKEDVPNIINQVHQVPRFISDTPCKDVGI